MDNVFFTGFFSWPDKLFTHTLNVIKCILDKARKSNECPTLESTGLLPGFQKIFLRGLPFDMFDYKWAGRFCK